MKDKWDLYSLFYNPLLRLAAKERSILYKNLALALDQPLSIYVAGCGTGLDLPYLPPKSRIYGVDFSANMLAKGEQLADSLRQAPVAMDIHLAQGKAETSGLPDNSQDLVLLHLILAVTPTPQALWAEAVRVLKPGGLISVWDKFLPPHQSASWCRRGLNRLTTALATSINLQFDPLWQTTPQMRILQREYRLGRLMQQIILQKSEVA